MRLTESQLRKLVRNKIQESFEGAQGMASWLKVRETKNVNDLLGMMNDKFRRDFEEALEWGTFGSCDNLDWFEGEAESLGLNPYEYMIENNSNMDYWHPEDIYKEGTPHVRWSLAIPIALHLIYRFHEENCSSFSYNFYGAEDWEDRYEKVKEILLHIVDMYDFPSSFSDIIPDQIDEASYDTGLDRQVGHIRFS